MSTNLVQRSRRRASSSSQGCVNACGLESLRTQHGVSLAERSAAEMVRRSRRGGVELFYARDAWLR